MGSGEEHCSMERTYVHPHAYRLPVYLVDGIRPEKNSREVGRMYRRRPPSHIPSARTHPACLLHADNTKRERVSSPAAQSALLLSSHRFSFNAIHHVPKYATTSLAPFACVGHPYLAGGTKCPAPLLSSQETKSKSSHTTHALVQPLLVLIDWER
jgi:hypothetical protein